MARGPSGEKRPGDVIGAAITSAKVLTGEIDEELPDPDRRRGGQKGGRARAEKLSPERRSEIAKKADDAKNSKN